MQFVETLSGPGLIEHTIINRDTDIESITETTSTLLNEASHSNAFTACHTSASSS